MMNMETIAHPLVEKMRKYMTRIIQLIPKIQYLHKLMPALQWKLPIVLFTAHTHFQTGLNFKLVYCQVNALSFRNFAETSLNNFVSKNIVAQHFICW